MSECVVRMEMPQNCWVCPFGSDRFIWDENDGRPHYVMVRFCSRHSGEEFHVLETDTVDRPWFCDSFICSLPEGHGRLIEADEFLKRAIGTKCFHEEDDSRMLEQLVGESITIVTATERSEA